MQVIRSLSRHSTGVVSFGRHAPSIFLSTTDATDAAAGGRTFRLSKGFSALFSLKCTARKICKMMAGRPGPVWLCPATRKVSL